MFIKDNGSNFVALLVYVNDIIITYPSSQMINDIKSFFQSQFIIKDLKDLKYFHVLGIAQLRLCIFL